LAASTAATAIALSILVWRAQAIAGNADRLRAQLGSEQAAAARLASLSTFDDSHLSALRERARRFRQGLGGTGTLQAVLRTLGTRWVRVSETTSEHGTYVTRTERFAMTSPTSADWPAIVGNVDAIEKLPGVGVQELDLQSAEGTGARSLGEASMVLVVEISRDAGAEASR